MKLRKNVIKIEFPTDTSEPLSEELAVKSMMHGIDQLIKIHALEGNPDDILLNYYYNPDTSACTAELDANSMLDPSKMLSLGTRYSFKVPEDIEDAFIIEPRTFSTATIKERLRVSGLDPKVKFRVTILDYQRYYAANKAKLLADPITLTKLKNMFLLDTMGIFNEILPYIQEGKQLANLTGLTNVTKGMNAQARDLSLAYKRALDQSKTSGALSKNILMTLKDKYALFMNSLISQVFPGIDNIKAEIIKESPRGTQVTSKSFADGGQQDNQQSQMPANTSNGLRTGVITIHTSAPDLVEEFLNLLKTAGENNASVNINMTDSNNATKQLSWNLSGADKITEITKESYSSFSYNFTNDGRVKLF